MCLDVLDCARRQHSMCRMRVRAPYATTSGRRVSGPAGLHADARQFVVVTRATRAHESRARPATCGAGGVSSRRGDPVPRGDGGVATAWRPFSSSVPLPSAQRTGPCRGWRLASSSQVVALVVLLAESLECGTVDKQVAAAEMA